MAFLQLIVPLLLATFVCAVAPPASRMRHGMHKVDVPSYETKHKYTGEALASLDTTYYFDQLIDHNDPSLGTFQQRYWFSYSYYQPGGPILIMNAGEDDASGYIGYLTPETITGSLAEKLNGTVILLEHRFFGESNPYPDLSEKSYKVHTLQQAIDDHEYFAKNVKLDMPGGDQLGPDKAPWILFGGSYPGALTSYTMYNKPGLFYAGYASSAVVEAISDFWGYYEPTRQYMAKNCSADAEAVIAHVDTVLNSSNTTAIQALKANFGLDGVTHDDDFAYALASVMQTWQDLLLSDGAGSTFFQFCDALEVESGGKVAGPNGWGLDHALAAWGAYYKESFLPSYCGGSSSAEVGQCFDTYNSGNPAYTDTAVNNWVRSWYWLLCNDFGFWQDGAPKSSPTLVSRFVTPAYFERQCTYFFPDTFSSPPQTSVDATQTNKLYGGWNVTTERLIFLNGERDPWREATVAADGTTNTGTDLQPHLLGEGFHCSDMLIAEGDVNPSVQAVQQKTLQYYAQWLSEWKPSA
ncbi:peptidase S28 [Cubamyces sp. BRFM 1775]|nr:peptidase S28 [Cubamyces sp. BRFM 1775]